MRTNLIRIGNSQGIRIPKAVVEQCGFEGEVEMRVEGRSLILSPARPPRHGWDEAFAAMAGRGDDAPLMPDDLEHGFDRDEWAW